MGKYNLIVSSTNKIKTMEKIMTSMLCVIKLLIHFTEFAVHSTLVISTPLISNNRLSREENPVLVLT